MNLTIILVKLVLEWLKKSLLQLVCLSILLPYVNFSNETSEEELLRLIGNLSESKAINENDIPTKIIKLAKFVLVPILTRIFNKCIKESFYPDCIKVAKLYPSTNLQNKIFAQIINQYLFCYSSITSLKEFYVTECSFIYMNISYYRNINLVSGLDVQLHMQLRVFTPIF